MFVFFSWVNSNVDWVTMIKSLRWILATCKLIVMVQALIHQYLMLYISKARGPVYEPETCE